jgi:hypothetical protein
MADSYEQEGFAYDDERIAAGVVHTAESVQRNLGIPEGLMLRDWMTTAPR